MILIGKNGYRKARLVRFLAKARSFRLFTLDIYGGTTARGSSRSWRRPSKGRIRCPSRK